MSSSIVDARERLGGAWLGRSALLASRSLIDSKPQLRGIGPRLCRRLRRHAVFDLRSEEHTSELQSQSNLVCRLLLEKKKEKRHVLKLRRKCTLRLPVYWTRPLSRPL